MKLLNLLYALAGLAVFLILVWLFAVPNELLREKAENSVSRSGDGNMTLSIEGLRKGIFFSLYADAVDLRIENEPAVRITSLSIKPAPRSLMNTGSLAFSINGEIGSGTLKGTLKLPIKGDLRIDNADLSSIPYLNRLGLKVGGHLFSDIKMENEKINALFNIPDLNIHGPETELIPLLDTFRRMQGSVHLEGNYLRVDSVSLEGEKGFARLKGKIVNGFADMTLELMPLEKNLTTLESMLIGKYIVSPGYYTVPLKGPVAPQ